jgi:ankyrin repeat protein
VAVRHFSLLPIVIAVLSVAGFFAIRMTARAIRTKSVIGYAFISLLAGFLLLLTAVIYAFVAISLSGLHGAPPETAYIGWLLVLSLFVLPVAGLLFLRFHQQYRSDRERAGRRFTISVTVFALLWLVVAAVLSGRLTMILALERNDTDTVKLLLSLGISANMRLIVTGEEHRPLHYAAYNGNPGMVRLLLANGADIKADKALLIEAVIGGNPEVVKILLQEGADPNKESGYSSPLMCAVEKGDGDMVRLLVNSGAGINFINSRDMTALDTAREKGFGEIARLLLNLGAREKVSSPQREMALYSAVDNRDFQKMGHLLDKGTDIDCLDGLRQTPLIHASAYGNSKAALWLLEHGARADIRDVNGRDALWYASEKGLADLVELLLKKKPVINYFDRYQKTPLMAACEQGHLAVVKQLHGNGADAGMRSGIHGKTALDLAREKNYSEIVHYLMAHSKK